MTVSGSHAADPEISHFCRHGTRVSLTAPSFADVTHYHPKKSVRYDKKESEENKCTVEPLRRGGQYRRF